MKGSSELFLNFLATIFFCSSSLYNIFLLSCQSTLLFVIVTPFLINNLTWNQKYSFTYYPPPFQRGFLLNRLKRLNRHLILIAWIMEEKLGENNMHSSLWPTPVLTNQRPVLGVLTNQRPPPSDRWPRWAGAIQCTKRDPQPNELPVWRTDSQMEHSTCEQSVSEVLGFNFNNHTFFLNWLPHKEQDEVF